MWQELIAPVIVIEFVSGDGQEERDKTPYKGQFWVYEQAIRVPFYAIYEVEKSSVEVYHLLEGLFKLCQLKLKPSDLNRFHNSP